MNYFASLYLHIPFCKKKCSFCNFFSAQNISETVKETYTQTLLSHINNYVQYLDNLESIYFGGGTPLELGIDRLKRVVNYLKERKIWKNNIETTIELNPEDLIYTEDLLELGFNRFSIGIQSFNNNLLLNIGRNKLDLKLLKTAVDTVKLSNKLVSFDFMFGLPGEKIQDIKLNLKYIKQLAPQHVSYYMFTTHKNYKWTQKQANEESIVKFIYTIKYELEQLAYKHYEVSNYAKDKATSVHNTNYWKRKTYLGVGAGAHSFNGKARWWNNKNLYKYNSGDFLEGREILTFYQHRIEQIMLGLRMLDIGVKQDLISSNIDKNIAKMLIKYTNKNAEIYYKIRPEYIHMIDLVEKELSI